MRYIDARIIMRATKDIRATSREFSAREEINRGGNSVPGYKSIEKKKSFGIMYKVLFTNLYERDLYRESKLLMMEFVAWNLLEYSLIK